MDFSTTITNMNIDYSTNAINDYNKLLQGNASFQFDSEVTEFDKILDTAKSVPLKDKNDPSGFGSFMEQIASSLGNGLNAVNQAKLEADRMQEDIASGGPTSIHDAMIAAEKADLSMQMAVQVRNRLLQAYSEISSMA